LSLLVQNLTRIYGRHKAVDDLSFQIQTGQVVGLLGPNGAGKSTTMKILTSYLSPSSGRAEIGGLDVVTHSLETRRMLGYLPESNPLYTDMYVREYLESAAAYYKLDRPLHRVEHMIEQTGLGPQAHKRIGQLSKGYRQRVGLAQALVHDPQVLILDEPTSGLDPNQLVGIRELIKGLATSKTVLLSTHILQEVEAICQRALIIHQGKLVADDALETLRADAASSTIELEWDREPDWDRLGRLHGVLAVRRKGPTAALLEVNAAGDTRKVLFDWSVQEGLSLVRMEQPLRRNLESVFRELTSNTESPTTLVR
jgi:ABC-2 type transport system ATP-binding protein